jgi:S1-C subfamily serine protease
VALIGGVGGGATTVVETVRLPVRSGAVTDRFLTVSEIYQRAASGVVQVSTGRSAPGSGFVIDKAGHVVTSDQAVAAAAEIRIGFSRGDDLSAGVVGSDPSTGIAVLKVDASSRALTPLPIGDSDDVQVGHQVVAIGNPRGVERTATAGIVSSLERGVTAPNGYTIDHVIQTDAAIGEGISGGPLLNNRGEVIGIVSPFDGGFARSAMGFAVPSSILETVVAQILEKGRVDRAYIGVAVTPITPELVRTFRLPVTAGVMVESVAAGSPAAKAGLRGGQTDVIVAGEGYSPGGDVIVAAGGERVRSIADLRDIVAEHEPGDTIELDVRRGADDRTVRVKLGRQPASPRR